MSETPTALAPTQDKIYDDVLRATAVLNVYIRSIADDDDMAEDRQVLFVVRDMLGKIADDVEQLEG